MTILLLLASFNSFAETTIEPKIIEYKGVKAEDLQEELKKNQGKLKNQITNFENDFISHRKS
jgi:hypothetical protein